MVWAECALQQVSRLPCGRCFGNDFDVNFASIASTLTSFGPDLGKAR